MKRRVTKSVQKTSVRLDSRRFDAIEAILERMMSKMVTRDEFAELKSESRETKEMMIALVSSVDRHQKSVDDILLEYAVIRQQMNRYDRWFKEIAEKLGIELKP